MPKPCLKGHSFAKECIVTLETILKEEVSHVKKEGVNPENYFDIVEKILPAAKKKKPFVNVKARQKAGFSCQELRVITDEMCED